MPQTKDDIQRAIEAIRKHVRRADEIFALDHNRTDTSWAYDFGRLESCVGFIRDELAYLDVDATL